MARQRLISGVVGGVLAVLLLVVFAYFVSGWFMALWWRDTSALLWSSLGLALTGVFIGGLARVGSGYSLLALIPAVLLGLAYTLGGPLGPWAGSIAGWDPNLAGFDPSSLVAVGALLAVSLWLHWDADDSMGHEPRSTESRSMLVLVAGAFLTLLFLGVLDRLQRVFFNNTSLQEFAAARWQVLGFIILGGLFAGVFLATWRTPLLNIGALAMLCFVFLAHPVLFGGASQWASRLLALAQDAQIAMMSPAMPLMAGVLTGILASHLTFRPGGPRRVEQVGSRSV